MMGRIDEEFITSKVLSSEKARQTNGGMGLERFARSVIIQAGRIRKVLCPKRKNSREEEKRNRKERCFCDRFIKRINKQTHAWTVINETFSTPQALYSQMTFIKLHNSIRIRITSFPCRPSVSIDYLVDPISRVVHVFYALAGGHLGGPKFFDAVHQFLL